MAWTMSRLKYDIHMAGYNIVRSPYTPDTALTWLVTNAYTGKRPVYTDVLVGTGNQ